MKPRLHHYGPLLLLTAIVAQTPTRSVAELAAALAKPDAAAVAQAAHDARALGDKKLRGALLQAIEHWTTSTDDNHTLVCLHVLDALIGIGAKVPGQSLQELLDDDDCGVAAFVLLAREPQQNERLLLEMFRRGWHDEQGHRRQYTDLRTWAIGNLLAMQAAPGFAATIANDVQLDLEVSIGTGARGPNNLKLFLPDWVAPRPSGFLPRPVYTLVRTPATGAARELAPGVMPIDFTRTLFDENAKLQTIAIGDLSLAAVGDDGMGWLQLMVQLTHRPSRRLEFALVDDQYVRDVVKARDGLQHFLDDLRTRLVERRAMTTDEAKVLEHKVAVHIQDYRSGSPSPLPQIPDAR